MTKGFTILFLKPFLKFKNFFSHRSNKKTLEKNINIIDNESDFIESGESFFLDLIVDSISIIFDVGTKDYSCFVNLDKEVHFFEPIAKHIEILSMKSKHNTKHFFNCFALGNENCEKNYYTKSQSFCNRKRYKSTECIEKIKIKRGSDYINSNDIRFVDFLKIDVEGYELEVIKGFGEKLFDVGIIQFEYGGTFEDMGIKLVDVISHLEKYNFTAFSYLSKTSIQKINDFSDHYQYSNIVCYNRKSRFCNIF